MQHAHPIAETKAEAFARLKPTCRARLILANPRAPAWKIDAMLRTLVELEYDAERSRAYRESRRIPLVPVERIDGGVLA